jgi:hypothetical protein
MSDIAFTIGADSSQLKAGLNEAGRSARTFAQNTQNEVNKTAGAFTRLGAAADSFGGLGARMLEGQAGKWLRVAGGIGAVGAGLVVLFKAVEFGTTVWDQIATRQLRAAESARKYEQELQRVRAATDAILRAGERDRGIGRDTNILNIDRARGDLLVELATSRRQLAAQSGAGAFFRDIKSFGGAFSEDGLSEAERAAMTEGRIQTILRALKDLDAERARVETAAAQRRREAASEFGRDTDISILEAQGRTREALEQREAILHEERLKRIREIGEIDQAAQDALIGREKARHDARMAQIEREANAKKFDAERSARFELRQFEIDMQRVAGREKEADIAQRQLDSDTRIEEIRRRTDLSDPTRDKLIDAERRLLAARQEAPERLQVSRYVFSGFTDTAQVANRVAALGATNPVAQQTAVLNRVNQTLRTIDERVSQLTGGGLTLTLQN